MKRKLRNLPGNRKLSIGLNIFAAFLVAITVFGVYKYVDYQRYSLDGEYSAILGEANSNLVEQIGYDSETDSFVLNKSKSEKLLGDSTSIDENGEKAISSGQGSASDQFDIALARQGSKGINITDKNLDLSISIVPEFEKGKGRIVQGRLVYPIEDTNIKAVYTVEETGLKEDILYSDKTDKSEAEYSYKLNLPEELEARLQDDGSVGVFSADPNLFTKETSLSEQDAEMIRESKIYTPKYHKVFELPAPVIYTADKQSHEATAKFRLSGDKLTLVAYNLDSIEGSFSIDPTVVVTSSAELSTGRSSNIDFSDGTASRTELGYPKLRNQDSSGVNSLPGSKINHSSEVYNSYIYVIGGNDGTSAVDTVYYAPLSNDGSVGTWSSTTTLPNPREGHSSGVFGGRLYVIGGRVSGTVSDSVISAPLNSNGTIGAWRTETSLPAAREGHGSAQYRNYIYAISGRSSGGSETFTSYVGTLNADGSIDSWTTTAVVSTQVFDTEIVRYGDYLYKISGNNQGSPISNVESTAINNDGTLDDWQIIDSAPVASEVHAATVAGGYIVYVHLDEVYFGAIVGGGEIDWLSSPNDELTFSAVEPTLDYYNGRFIAIDEDDVLTLEMGRFGTVHDVQYSGELIPTESCGVLCTEEGVLGHQMVAYKNYVYSIGGTKEEDDGSATYETAQVAYTSTNANGTINAWQTTTSLPAERSFHAATVIFDHIVVVAGNDSNGTATNTVYYAPINNNGTLGSWTTEAHTLPVTETGGFMVSARNNLYYIGGTSSSAVYKATVRNGYNGFFEIDSWTSQTSLPQNRSFHVASINGDKLYVYGGTGDLASVIYAPIADDGSLGSWQTSVSMPSGRTAPSITNHGDVVQILGGQSSSADYTDTIFIPNFNQDFEITSWDTHYEDSVIEHSYASAAISPINEVFVLVGGWTPLDVYSELTYEAKVYTYNDGVVNQQAEINPLPETRVGHDTLAIDNYLYVLGGSQIGFGGSEIAYAPILENGNLGTWQSAKDPTGFGSISGNYATNGEYMFAQSYPHIYYSKIYEDGSLSDWRRSPNSYSGLSSYEHVFVKGSYIYLHQGGSAASNNNIQYAQINSDGTVSNWQTENVGLGTTGGELHVVGDYLYALEGRGTHHRIFSLKFNSDGSPGPFDITSRFPHDQYFGDNNDDIVQYASAVVDDKYLYVIGGRVFADTVFDLDDIYYAEIEDDGSLSEWNQTIDFPVVMSQFSADTHNGRIYTAGGYSDTSSSDEDAVYVIDTNYTRKEGTYSRLFDLGALAKFRDVKLSGNINDGRNAITIQLAGSSGVLQSPTGVDSYDGTCTNGVIARYVMVQVHLDDRNDFNNQNSPFSAFKSYFDDMTVSYDVNLPFGVPVTERLRGGKHFDTELLQPLETDKLEEDAVKCSIP